MKLVFTILAEAQPIELLNRPLNGMSSSMREVVILLAAVAAPILLFLVWAVFIRKRRKPLSGWRAHSRSHSESSEGQSSEGPANGHRRRRRRREHRPRNPTLAEKGGLPPARSDRQEQVEGVS